MERFCTNCGNVLEDGALFCPECGERIAPAAEEKTEELEQLLTAPEEAALNPAEPATLPPFTGAALSGTATAVTAAATGPAAAAAPAGSAMPENGALRPAVPEGPEVINVYNKPLSTAAYFWTLLLFLIPGIGLIAMLIMAFASKNTNRKNLAQACLIGVLILLILLGLFMLVLVVSGKSFGVDISKFSFKAIWEGILTGIGFAK